MIIYIYFYMPSWFLYNFCEENMMGDLWPWVDDFQLNKLRAWGYEMVGSKMVSVFSITHFFVIRVFIWSGHGCFDKGLVGQRGKLSSKGLSLGMKRPTAACRICIITLAGMSHLARHQVGAIGQTVLESAKDLTAVFGCGPLSAICHGCS